jgi:hypothetical protein
MASIKKGINNQLFIDSSGNVGIGGNVPIDKLQVNGSLFVTGKIYNGSPNDSAGITFPGSSTRIDGFNGITFHASSTNVGSQSERMRITSSGNVGIGTTSPDALLEISGNAGADPGPVTNPITFRITDAGNAATGLGDTTNPWGRIQFYSEDQSSGGPSVQAQIASIYGNIYSSSSHLAFYTQAVPLTGIVERMRILDTGNVGIGTTAPTYKLSVQSTDTAGATGTGATLQLLSDTTAVANKGGSVIFGDAGNAIRAMIKGMYIGPAGSGGGLAFSTAEDSGGAITERMRLNSTGNVGIGTTAPAYKLHVDDNTAYGGVLIEGDNAPGLSIRDNSGTSLSKIYVQSTASSQGNLRISSDDNNTATTPTIEFIIGGSHKMRVLDNGNVGIGTTSPGAKLDVRGGALFVGDYTGTATPTDGIWMERPAGNSNQILMYTTGASVFSIVSTGTSASIGWGSSQPRTVNFVNTGAGDISVGIGTTSPAQKLDVAGGDIILSSNATYIRSKDASGNAPRMFGINPSNDTYIGPIDPYAGGAVFYGVSANISSQTFYTGASARLHINSAGNVGIGTTSPVSKLDVAGAGYFSGESLSAGLDQTYTNVGLLIDEGDYIYTKDSSVTLRILMGKVADIIKIGQNGTSLIDAIELIPGTTGGRVSIFDDTTETVRFQNGNVGIGTTNPTVPLQIVKDNATISMTNTTAFAVDTGSRLFLGGKYDTAGTTSPFAWIVGAKENATDGNQAGYLSITTVANGGGFAERMRITSAGVMAIGTSTPNGTVGKLEMGLDGAANGIGLYNGTGTSLRIWRESDIGNIGRGATPSISINASGNVGIGTTSPNEKLEVAGNIRLQNYGRLYLWRDNNSNYLDYNNWIANTGATQTIQNGGVGGITFKTLTNTRMFISSSGNVGIGTTSPTELLHVAGTPRIDSEDLPPAVITAQVTQDKYVGLNSAVLTDPSTWMKVNINGAIYLIPAYLYEPIWSQSEENWSVSEDVWNL